MTDPRGRPSPAQAFETAQELSISEQLQDLVVWMLQDKVEHTTIQEVVEKPWHFHDLLAAHRADPTKSASDVLDDLNGL